MSGHSGWTATSTTGTTEFCAWHIAGSVLSVDHVSYPLSAWDTCVLVPLFSSAPFLLPFMSSHPCPFPPSRAVDALGVSLHLDSSCQDWLWGRVRSWAWCCPSPGYKWGWVKKWWKIWNDKETVRQDPDLRLKSLQYTLVEITWRRYRGKILEIFPKPRIIQAQMFRVCLWACEKKALTGISNKGELSDSLLWWDMTVLPCAFVLFVSF